MTTPKQKSGYHLNYSGLVTTQWVCFCDHSYYNQWAVRPVDERRWGHVFHLPSEEEAHGLCERLAADQARIKELEECVRELTGYGLPMWQDTAKLRAIRLRDAFTLLSQPKV